MFRYIILMATSMLFACDISSASSVFKQQKLCLRGISQILADGHFSGPIVCSTKNATLKRVGRTVSKSYVIYDYKFRYFPTNGQQRHGGQKIIVLRNSKYIGQYNLPVPPFANIYIRADKLIIESNSKGYKTVVDLKIRPPASINVDSENITFFK